MHSLWISLILLNFALPLHSQQAVPGELQRQRDDKIREALELLSSIPGGRVITDRISKGNVNIFAEPTHGDFFNGSKELDAAYLAEANAIPIQEDIVDSVGPAYLAVMIIAHEGTHVAQEQEVPMMPNTIENEVEAVLIQCHVYMELDLPKITLWSLSDDANEKMNNLISDCESYERNPEDYAREIRGRYVRLTNLPSVFEPNSDRVHAQIQYLQVLVNALENYLKSNPQDEEARRALKSFTKRMKFWGDSKRLETAQQHYRKELSLVGLP